MSHITVIATCFLSIFIRLQQKVGVYQFYWCFFFLHVCFVFSLLLRYDSPLDCACQRDNKVKLKYFMMIKIKYFLSSASYLILYYRGVVTSVCLTQLHQPNRFYYWWRICECIKGSTPKTSSFIN